jgi:hypothetical protein
MFMPYCSGAIPVRGLSLERSRLLFYWFQKKFCQKVTFEDFPLYAESPAHPAHRLGADRRRRKLYVKEQNYFLGPNNSTK